MVYVPNLANKYNLPLFSVSIHSIMRGMFNNRERKTTTTQKGSQTIYEYEYTLHIHHIRANSGGLLFTFWSSRRHTLRYNAFLLDWGLLPTLCYVYSNTNPHTHTHTLALAHMHRILAAFFYFILHSISSGLSFSL